LELTWKGISHLTKGLNTVSLKRLLPLPQIQLIQNLFRGDSQVQCCIHRREMVLGTTP
jgi:hypothetical protein